MKKILKNNFNLNDETGKYSTKTLFEKRILFCNEIYSTVGKLDNAEKTSK
jgi:hypothetical protein